MDKYSMISFFSRFIFILLLSISSAVISFSADTQYSDIDPQLLSVGLLATVPPISIPNQPSQARSAEISSSLPLITKNAATKLQSIRSAIMEKKYKDKLDKYEELRKIINNLATNQDKIRYVQILRGYAHILKRFLIAKKSQVRTARNFFSALQGDLNRILSGSNFEKNPQLKNKSELFLANIDKVLRNHEIYEFSEQELQNKSPSHNIFSEEFGSLLDFITEVAKQTMPSISSITDRPSSKHERKKEAHKHEIAESVEQVDSTPTKYSSHIEIIKAIQAAIEGGRSKSELQEEHKRLSYVMERLRKMEYNSYDTDILEIKILRGYAFILWHFLSDKTWVGPKNFISELEKTLTKEIPEKLHLDAEDNNDLKTKYKLFSKCFKRVAKNREPYHYSKESIDGNRTSHNIFQKKFGTLSDLINAVRDKLARSTKMSEEPMITDQIKQTAVIADISPTPSSHYPYTQQTASYHSFSASVSAHRTEVPPVTWIVPSVTAATYASAISNTASTTTTIHTPIISSNGGMKRHRSDEEHSDGTTIPIITTPNSNTDILGFSSSPISFSIEDNFNSPFYFEEDNNYAFSFNGQ